MIRRVEGFIGFFSDRINTWGGVVSGIFILIMGIIVTHEVMMRFFFRSPTTWVLEISTYLCIASIFLTGGYVLKDKSHINVDLVISHFTPYTQILLQLIGYFLALVYCFVLTWKGAELAITSLRFKEVSTTLLNIPVFIPRSFVPVGGALLIMELVRQLLGGFSDLRDARKEANPESWAARNLPPLILAVLLVSCGAMFLSKDLAPVGLVVLLFVLIFSGMPIAFALGMLGLMGFYLTFGGGRMLAQVPLVSYKMLDDFVITAVPMFVMLATVLNIGKIGSSLFETASTWVRHLPGGMAVATIVACSVFAAICGSSSATVIAIGLIAIPEMLSRGYERKMVYGTVAIGGVLGPLIPPSIFMILIGTISGDSVGKLFMAGMLPGILLAIIFSGYIVLRSLSVKTLVRIAPASWKERWESMRKSFWGLLAPLIILGGIYSGVFTPSEAAGIGLIYSLFICAVIYRTLSPKRLWQIILDGAKLNAMVFFIVMGALVFGQVVTMLQIPERISVFITALPVSKMAILFMALIFILILGALMDEASILLIMYPILYYIFVKKFGFDSIWFALVFVVTLEVGLIAPPVGLNLFVVQAIDKTAKFDEVVRGVLPFMILMIASILLFVYFKPLSTWLPRIIG